MIYARLLPNQAVADSSQPHLADMARVGLRTLCLAQKDIPDQDYQVRPCFELLPDEAVSCSEAWCTFCLMQCSAYPSSLKRFASLLVLRNAGYCSLTSPRDERTVPIGASRRAGLQWHQQMVCMMQSYTNWEIMCVVRGQSHDTRRSADLLHLYHILNNSNAWLARH